VEQRIFGVDTGNLSELSPGRIALWRRRCLVVVGRACGRFRGERGRVRYFWFLRC
jgi:hypothetical protein